MKTSAHEGNNRIELFRLIRQKNEKLGRRVFKVSGVSFMEPGTFPGYGICLLLEASDEKLEILVHDVFVKTSDVKAFVRAITGQSVSLYTLPDIISDFVE